MAADPLVLNRQYWLYKLAPVELNTFAASHFWAHFLPSLALALAIFVPVSHFTGQGGGAMLPAAGLLALLLVSATALQQLLMLIEAARAGEELPLFSRIAREAAMPLYLLLFLLPPALALYYTQIGFLSFMHTVPQTAVMAAAIVITVVLAAAVTWRSLKSMTAVWQAMEIK
jgi:hypothetical protein